MAIKPTFPGAPPPAHTPSYAYNRKQGMPEVFSQYLHTYMYVWLDGGEGYWIFPVWLDDQYLSGYVWDDRWRPAKISWSKIDSFY